MAITTLMKQTARLWGPECQERNNLSIFLTWGKNKNKRVGSRNHCIWMVTSQWCMGSNWEPWAMLHRGCCPVTLVALSVLGLKLGLVGREGWEGAAIENISFWNLICNCNFNCLAVRQLHTEFLRAGADVLQTFTFSATEDNMESKVTGEPVESSYKEHSILLGGGRTGLLCHCTLLPGSIQLLWIRDSTECI